ncbi:prepilin-type N-terminal cleavage/methylation domain-containing protein [Capillibacterium thermochitinicola]|uniref:Prepilin-type N-terminal cleavage/methylation domain-containing protein n=1 Tax=Capillibacterium thermochitinicola TaxID=2699427 RepID=A0A8J6I293_9FIRM|nr:prepilin-type N-terminal cleavage/methylation domain-containing protein [Capillibacterium thermochitinicola]MBA2133374.1 prepilin-type N-terminal cleavage/methylation domain-containing protein [Capillibacterium thermochitinicola]
MRMAKRGDDGFTLLEVVLALVLIGLAVRYLMPAFSGFLVSDRYLTHRQEAYLLAAGKLEEIIYQVEKAHEGDFPAPWAHFHWIYRVERLGEGLVRHELTVNWRETVGERRISVSRLQFE